MQLLELKNDGTISVAMGASATSKTWKNTKLTWSALLTKLSSPVVTKETYKQFMAMSKDDQCKIKDVGGFVGGFLTNGRRNKNNVLYRQIVALDVDFSHKNIWWDFTNLYDCAACIHSTHKSNPESPRHRILLPLDREVSQEEYQAIARRIACDLGIDLFDRSTFDVNRCMFFPSVSCDMEYYFEYQDGTFLSADNVLSRYNDWQDTTEWAMTPDEGSDAVMQDIKKQEDPETKKGIVGVFCRTYTIQEAISRFLPEIYIPTASDSRFTYAKGTTAAGLIVYEDRFAYSHHGTDPAGGRLCNAFDLVRIHKFGHLDTGKDKDEKLSKSYKAMEAFCVEDPAVKRCVASEKFAEAKVDFANFDEVEGTDDSWVEQLEVNTKGDYENSASNINLIIQNDPRLKGAFALNEFDNRRYVLHGLPWRKIDGTELLKDVDYSGVRNYVECIYGIANSQKVDDALALEFEKNKFHPIRSYLKSLTWDGNSRVDTLLSDYFGAEDSPYAREAIRKTLCAAVARVFEPGTKYDLVLILVGEQGTFKSTFVKKLGMEWFSDTFTTVQGKEAFEQLQGAWLVEISELSGFKKAEIETIKHYVSKCEDSFRPAYGRVVETYKRQCVFIGTTNSVDFLRDATGNRRFIPIDVELSRAVKNVVTDLTQDEINQIWAEAYQLYLSGEALYFSSEVTLAASAEQRKHTEQDDKLGIVEDYLDKLYPDNWDRMDLQDRVNWLTSPIGVVGTKQKDYVCVAEIWCECLQKNKADMTTHNTREINDIMRSLSGWRYVTSTKVFPIYGKQRYYIREYDSIY